MAGYGGGSSVPRVREYPITLRDGTVIKAQMRTVQGNQDYLDVKWRAVWMRAENGHKIGVISEPLEHVFGRYAIFRTTLLDADGRIIAIAHKMETRDGFADYYEKAETGSLGRALAIAGYGTAFCGQDFSIGDGDDITEAGVETETAETVEEAKKAATAAAASRRRGMRNPAEIPTPATSNPPTSAAPTSAPSRTAAPTSADPVSPAPEPKPEPKPKAETAERKAPAKPEPAPAPEPEPKADEKPAEKAQPKAEEPKAEEPKAEQNSAAASDAKELTGEVIVASRPMTGTNAKNKPYCMVTAQYGQRKLRVVAMGTGDPKATGLMPKLQALKVGDRLNGKFQLIKGGIYAWVS